MDRTREARRATNMAATNMATPVNGLSSSRRRHRSGSLRDSPDEEGGVEVKLFSTQSEYADRVADARLIMAVEGVLSFSVERVMEDVLQQHHDRHRELDLDSRRAEEADTDASYPILTPKQEEDMKPLLG